MTGRDPETSPPGEAPLAGRTVVVTRPREQVSSLAKPLEALGASVLVVPVIRIVPRPLDREVAAALAAIARYQLVVFTSVNAVRIFGGYVQQGEAAPGGLRHPRRTLGLLLGGSVVAAIGPATAGALEARGVTCEIVPDDYVAEGLLEAFERRGIAASGARVLIPRARDARSVLPDTLRARGAVVDVLPVYDTVVADGLSAPRECIEAADYITFTSSSTVRRFAELMETGAGRPLAERLAGARLCSIGPVTSGTLRELGLPVALEAGVYTAAGLVAAIVRHAGAV